MIATFSEFPDILLFAVAVIGLFVFLWPRKPKPRHVSSFPAPVWEPESDIDPAKTREDGDKAFREFQAKVRRDYREWYGRDMPK